MSYENILYERDGHIARITLNRPEALNALSMELQEELVSAVRAAGEDDDVRVIILKGSGRAFSAGGDLRPRSGQAATEEAPRRTIMQGRRGIEQWRERLFVIWDLPKPVIAQVHGYCLAMGSVLALMCDITIAAEDARFGPAQAPLGAGAVAPLWIWLIGVKKSKEIFFPTGVMIDGKEAERIGLINRAVPAERLEEAVNRLAEKIAETPLELLTLQKLVANRVQELMGLRTAVLMGAEMDAMAHVTGAVTAFNQLTRDLGLKDALARWRELIP